MSNLHRLEAAPNLQLIAQIEKMLEQATSGDMRDMAACCTHRNGDISTIVTLDPNAARHYTLLAASSRLQYRINKDLEDK